MASNEDVRQAPIFPRQQILEPKKLSLAISAVLAAPAGTVVAQDDAGSGNSRTVEEVMVTARKREESLQDIPQSIQAIGANQIKEAGFSSMDDYVRFIPSMSYAQVNPGTSMVVFRGIADAQNSFIAEPSAAVYIDEQSLTLNATPDPRMVDIERVEALSGPQGTLYGASAQSGTLRIITNKPDPAAFDANVDLTYKSMSKGDSSYDASAMVNVPLGDNAAIRLVGFSAKDGGFIDNVLGTSPRFGYKTNAGAEESDFNQVDTSGGRIAARWLPNDNWTITAGVIYQKTDSDGRPEMDPTIGDLQVVRWYPNKEYDNQDWTQYQLTVEADFGFADFVSATSYFERDWEYTQDTTTYAAYFGTFCYAGHYDAAGYYQAGVGGYSRYCFQPAGVGNYYNEPTGWLINTQRNTKFSQEFRLASTGERMDWTAGVFYERARETWDFHSYADGYDQSQAMLNMLDGRLAWSGLPTPSAPYGDNSWFGSFDRTDFEQKAIFGEVTFHLTDQVDLNLGARWFDRTMDKVYWVEQPTDNISGEGVLTPSSDVSDWVPKVSLKYQINDDWMVYGLYSEGFRPGGSNRGRGIPYFPRLFDSDTLENIEFGAKSNLANGKVRMNATYFDMSWKDYQLELVDPSYTPCGDDDALPEPNCGQPWQKVVANVGDASSRGFELQVDTVPTERLTIGVNATWLDAKIDNVDEIISDIVINGSRLPLSPEFKGSLYATYEWPVDFLSAGSAFIRFQTSYVGDMLNQVESAEYVPFEVPAPQLVQPSYTISDLKFGLNGDDWSVQLFVNNMTDERAVLFDNSNEFDRFWGRGRQTVNRPREYGVRYIKSFGK